LSSHSISKRFKPLQIQALTPSKQPQSISNPPFSTHPPPPPTITPTNASSLQQQLLLLLLLLLLLRGAKPLAPVKFNFEAQLRYMFSPSKG